MSLYPWSGSKEWDNVFEMLYSSESNLRRKGLARVAAWKTRGVIPALLEVTVDLISCSVHEEECAEGPPKFVGRVLQLMYAMALTRFVNGAFDVHYVISSGLNRDIRTVLGHCGVPSYIVTLRHHCAHRTLPSLESLKCAADAGLKWLLHNYWEPQRLLNHQRGGNTEELGSGTGDGLVFNSARRERALFHPESRNRKTMKRTKSFLSDCSMTELSQQVLCSQFLNIAESEVILPVEAEPQQILPQLHVEGPAWTHWKKTVREVAEVRPGLETLVISAVITAMHDSQCECCNL
jgi:hypothetical protein